MPLPFAGVGKSCTIQKITGKDEVRRHLASLGFAPGETVTIISELGGSLIIGVRESRVALDRGLAGRILV